LKKLPKSKDVEDTGTLEEREKTFKEKQESNESVSILQGVEKLCMSEEDLVKYDYILKIPEIEESTTSEKESFIGKTKECGRSPV
jgi:hypothetical protein